MAVAQGQCPQCGAPMTFGVGASVSQVCKYCRHAVVRTDRDFRNMGKVADLALVPSVVAVGDTGTIDGRQVRIEGRVQLDHGAGPWDEWYVAFHDGAWGWLASAQGNWYVTQQVAPPSLPPWSALVIEEVLMLGAAGRFVVAEKKRGTITSGEGELPFAVEGGQTRYYADLHGPNGGFATIDYGDGRTPPVLFVGMQRPEGALQLKAQSERPVTEISTEAITCPNCGGNVPALAPKRSERLACPYCNAVSEIASRRVVEQQQAARMAPDIPLGSRGQLDGQEYIVCGYVERASDEFAWQEYLLYGPGLGFRWLVKDENTWLFVGQVSVADVDMSSMPRAASYAGVRYTLRNRNPARVTYVLGELYWKVAVGETVEAMDFTHGNFVLSRERAGDEVAWSLCSPKPWRDLAAAFRLDPNGTGARLQGGGMPSFGGGGGGGETSNTTVGVIVLIIFLIIVCAVCAGDCGGGGGGGSGFWGSWGSSRGGK